MEINAMEFKISPAHQTTNTGFHGQVAVKWYTKVLDGVTQGNTENDALPAVTESWKEEERDRGILPEDAIIASVLSPLSLSLFNVLQDLTSSAHFRKERMRSGI